MEFGVLLLVTFEVSSVVVFRKDRFVDKETSKESVAYDPIAVHKLAGFPCFADVAKFGYIKAFGGDFALASYDDTANFGQSAS